MEDALSFERESRPEITPSDDPAVAENQDRLHHHLDESEPRLVFKDQRADDEDENGTKKDDEKRDNEYVVYTGIGCAGVSRGGKKAGASGMMKFGGREEEDAKMRIHGRRLFKELVFRMELEREGREVKKVSVGEEHEEDEIEAKEGEELQQSFVGEMVEDRIRRGILQGLGEEMQREESGKADVFE